MTETPNTLTAWLDQAQARADAATEGPWVASLAGRGARVTEPSGYPLPGCFSCGQNEDGIYEPPDATFIAAARTDLPKALDALRAVLNLHAPYRDRAGEAGDCAGCLAIDPGAYVPWPCPTVRAVRLAVDLCPSCGEPTEEFTHTAPGFEGLEGVHCTACGWEQEQ